MDPIDAVQAAGAQAGSLQSEAASAFGLEFEDLLKIVLTQLTYQDPLKPVENFEFVSQLAQFTQIQQGETISDRLLGVQQSGQSAQAVTLLGRTVDIPAGEAVLTGKIVAVTYQNGEPRLTLETDQDQTIGNIGLSAVSRIAEEE